MLAYAVVSLLSAFLLFLVQPLIAKAILPWFGGAPAVWTICLLFFQSVLLAGYAYAHYTGRLPAKKRVVLHGVLLLLTLITLPIIPAASWKPDTPDSPIWRILGLLTVTVGAPYLMLATTAPILQDWYGRETAGTGASAPYRLYAWSNVGSLVALFGYPFLFERTLPIPAQARVWSWAYVGFVVGILMIGWRVRGAGGEVRGGARVSSESDTPSPARAIKVLWFSLAAAGSGLLMVITNQLTLDVAAVPFLWVIPLSLYLLTFIVAFAGKYHRALWRPGFIIGLGFMAVLYKLGATASLPLQVAGSAFTLFAGCMICNGELVRLSPPPRHLTAFYLTMSAGGAVGGLLVAVVAPAVFPDFWELPLFLMLPYVLMAAVAKHEEPLSRRPATWLAVGGVLWIGVALFLLPSIRGPGTTIKTSRNFYGVLRVYEDYSDSLRPTRGPTRELRHGRITHGTQLLDSGTAALRLIPTSYYAEGSGVQVAIDHHPRRAAGEPLVVGAIGLGVGTIAAYGVPADTFRFYEINPQVEILARRYFSFLAESRAPTQVVLGDGRLSLEREVASGAGRKHYDIIVADAFSGDAIPMHLLTREAMTLYWEALKDDGILAIHTSNRYLNLARVVSGLAPTVRKRVIRLRRPGTGAAFASTWLLVTSNVEFMKWVQANVTYGADIPAEPAVVWTDDFSNLYEVLGDGGP